MNLLNILTAQYKFRKTRIIFGLILFIILYILILINEYLEIKEIKLLLIIQNNLKFNNEFDIIHYFLDSKVILFLFYILYLLYDFKKFNIHLIIIFFILNIFLYLSLFFKIKRPYWNDSYIYSNNCIKYYSFPDFTLISLYLLYFIFIRFKYKILSLILYFIMITLFSFFNYLNGNIFIKEIIENFLLLIIIIMVGSYFTKINYLNRILKKFYKKKNKKIYKYIINLFIFYGISLVILKNIKNWFKEDYFKNIVYVDNFLKCHFKNRYTFEENLYNKYFYFKEDDVIFKLHYNGLLILIYVYFFINLTKRRNHKLILKSIIRKKILLLKFIFAFIFLAGLFYLELFIKKIKNRDLNYFLRTILLISYSFIIFYLQEIIFIYIIARRKINKENESKISLLYK